MNLTDYTKEALLSALAEDVAFSIPQLYLALHTAATADDGTGAEVVGGSYARQAVTWEAIVAGATENADPITYDNLPATTVGWAALWDSLVAGNMIAHAAVTGGSVTFTAGQDWVIDAHDVDLSFD